MYCRNCGKQIEDIAKICPNCGVRIVSKPSNFWYLLPLIFNMIGGIIGYYALRNKDMPMAKNMIYLGIGIFLLFSVLPYLIISNDPNTNVKSNIATPIATPIVIPIVTPIVTPIASQNDDKKFLVWAQSSMEVLSNDIKDVSDAALSTNFKLTELYGKILKDNSQKYLQQIDDFSVSSNIKELSDEYKNALEDFYLAGKYVEQGAKNMDSNDIEMGGKYMTAATDHINKISRIAKSKVPVTDKFVQTWPKDYGSTTCEEWLNKMTNKQKFVAAADMLIILRESEGISNFPSDTLIEQFVTDISVSCEPIPYYKINENAVSIFIIGKDMYTR